MNDMIDGQSRRTAYFGTQLDERLYRLGEINEEILKESKQSYDKKDKKDEFNLMLNDLPSQ